MVAGIKDDSFLYIRVERLIKHQRTPPIDGDALFIGVHFILQEKE